jgi:hypothetical protein
MSHKNVTKVVMAMVSGVSVQVSVSGFKGSTFKGSEVREQGTEDR